MRIAAACAVAVAVGITGCGSSSSKPGHPTSTASTVTAGQSTASGQSPTAAPAADLKAHWFAVTSRFPGAGHFQGGPVQPSTPHGGGLGAVGTVNYYGPGHGPSEVTMLVTGPLPEYDTGSLQGSAAAYVRHALGGKVLKGPAPTTMGGQPAEAYFGQNSHGSEYALVVMHNDGNTSARGTYVAQLTAPAAVFRSYVSAFDTVFRSFQLLNG